MWNHPFELFSAPTPETNADDAAGVYAAEPPTLSHRWPRCGGRMIIIEDLRTRRDGRQLTMLMAVRCDARGGGFGRGSLRPSSSRSRKALRLFRAASSRYCH